MPGANHDAYVERWVQDSRPYLEWIAKELEDAWAEWLETDDLDVDRMVSAVAMAVGALRADHA